MFRRRVFISMPGDIWLGQTQNTLKWAIVEEIEKLGYEAQIFVGPGGGQGLAAPLLCQSSFAPKTLPISQPTPLKMHR